MAMKICKSTNKNYRCTRPEYHDGGHETRGFMGNIVYTWETRKDEKMKYKSLKPITLKAINEILYSDCNDFRRFARRVVKDDPIYGWGEIPMLLAIDHAFQLGYSNWFTYKGFIEEDKEAKTWTIGDKVSVNGKTYIIANPDMSKLNLIDINSGNTLMLPIYVKNFEKITLSEMIAMGYKGD